jgi:hypothetical protein
VDCGIGREPTPWSSMSMSPENLLCHPRLFCRLPTAGCGRWAPQAIRDANGVKWSGRARRFSKHTPSSGEANLGTRASAIPAGSCTALFR